MWKNLSKEIESQKYQILGPRYGQFREIGNSFFRLLAHLVSSQDSDGSWGDRYIVLTAHMVRLLTEFGVSLDERWNKTESDSQIGNVGDAVSWLLTKNRTDARKPPWGDDVWDTCYVLLALMGVESASEKIPRERKHANCLSLGTDIASGIDWVATRAADGFKAITKGEWYGPGFCAGGVELLSRVRKLPHGDQTANIQHLVNAATELLAQDPKDRQWDSRFAWHVGQIVRLWKGQRKKIPSLHAWDTDIKKLYDELIRRQESNGDWGNPQNRDPVESIYNTVRALQACYAMESNPATSDSISRAHNYLLERAAETIPLLDLKACANAIEAYRDLLAPNKFSLSQIQLFDTIDGLARLGIVEPLLNSEADPNESLISVRAHAQKALEHREHTALEVLGVNACLYDHLISSDSVLREFGDNTVETRTMVKDFLSTTMTEVRGNLARQLIQKLWDHAGLFNFLPLVKRLSDLEFEGTFFAQYRDHVNHQVLFFLLGSYIYMRCAPLRDAIDTEIARTATDVGAPTYRYPEAEFLFRWKLVSTFHDVGYLFEAKREDSNETKASIKLIDAFRLDFLDDYLKRIDKDVSDTDRAALLAELRIPECPLATSTVEDLFASPSQGFVLLESAIHDSDRIRPDLLKDYLKMCREESAGPGREPFLDHGIMSGLTLLRTIAIQRYYLEGLLKEAINLRSLAQKSNMRLAETLRLFLATTPNHDLSDISRVYARFAHVGAASALHNIYPHLYGENVCKKYNLDSAFYPKKGDSKRFGISLEHDPFAYLTALVDVLQDWDRHSFRAPGFDGSRGRPMAAADILIEVTDDKIHLIALTPHAKKRYHGHISELGETLIDYNKLIDTSRIDAA